MGEVYRARDGRLGREVAIKVVSGGVVGDLGRLARFEREARLLASLNHPGIAAVYGFEDQGGTPFIVMELVPGETLSEQMSRGPLPLREALEIARQVAEALESAHERGVVHRDLKPGNIKVTPEGKAKVLDLGLAKAFDVKSSDDMSRSPTVVLEQTRPGVILGTAEFMSPEQARGKSVDKRTDIWAFGCVLYEMLSGQRAFTGETITDVLSAILTQEPDWSALPAQTPPRVRELLGRCLQKDPNRRLRDIGDARIALEEVVKELEGAEGRAASGPRPRIGRVLPVAVALALVAALGGWLAWRSRGNDDPPQRGGAAVPGRKYLAILPFKDLSLRPDGQLIGDGFAEVVSNRMARISGVQVVTPSAATAVAGRTADPYEAAKMLQASVLVRGSVQQQGEKVRVTFSVHNAEARSSLLADGITGQMSDLFAIQDQVAERVAGSLRLPQPAPSAPVGLEAPAQLNAYLKALGLLQRYEQQSSVESAIAVLEPLARDGKRPAPVLAALGRAYLHMYDHTKNRGWAEKAMRTCDEAKATGTVLPEIHVTIGELLNKTGKPDEAAAEFEKALTLQPDYALAVIGLGDAHRAAGRLPEAERSYRRAIALQPGYWSAYNRLGVFYFNRTQYPEAAAMFRRVIELTPDNSRAYLNLGSAYLFLERLDDSRAAFEEAIRLQPTGYGFTNLGNLEFFAGNYAASAKNFEKAVQMTPDDYLLWANLGDAYRWTPGRERSAGGAFAKAISLGKDRIAVNPNDATIYANLAAVYAKTGDRSQAGRQIARALQLDPRSTHNMYKAAVVAIVGGQREEALEWIQQAVAGGYSRSQIQRDPEFASLRGEATFREALKAVS